MAYRSEVEQLKTEKAELVRRLASADKTIESLRHPPETSGSWLRSVVGGSTRGQAERLVHGTLRDEALSKVLDFLNRRFDVAGDVVRLDGYFGWSSPRTFEQSSNMEFSLSEVEGGVIISARRRPARFGVVMYALLVGIMLPFGLAAAVSVTHLWSFALASSLFLLSIVCARALYRRWVAREARTLTAAVEGAAEIFSSTIPRLRIDDAKAQQPRGEGQRAGHRAEGGFGDVRSEEFEDDAAAQVTTQALRRHA